MNSKHWEDVYGKKGENEVSWYQGVPTKSLELIAELNLDPNDSIIDIGGGDSRLVDNLLERGFKRISVLDISHTALDRAKHRLGKKCNKVNFIVSDVIKFSPAEKYNLWHDRATFHFLTTQEDVERYLEIANQSIARGGYLIVSTFSKTGPDRCSGLSITQYADVDLKALFGKYFTNIKCVEDAHKTPWGSVQNFVYCGFKRKST